MKIYLLTMVVFILSVNLSFSQWENLSNGLLGGKINSIAFRDTNIFAGIDGGFYLSTDNGNSWSQRNNGLTHTTINTIAINGANIFVGTYIGGVYMSTDNGRSWPQKNNGLSIIVVYSLLVYNNNIYAGTNAGVYLSTDNGNNWTRVGLNNMIISSFAFQGNFIFAGSNMEGIFLSSDNGSHWVEKCAGFSNQIRAIVIGDDFILAGVNGNAYQTGILLSTDFGKKWYKSTKGLTNRKVNALAINNNNVFAGTEGGVFLSTDKGKNWAPVNKGFQDSIIYSLAINTNSIYAGTGDGHFYRAKLSDFITTEMSDKFNNKTELLISPNPATDFIEINLDSPSIKMGSGGVFEIGIYDVFGRKLTTLSTPFNSPASGGQLTIDVSGLVPGMYFVRMGDKVEKFVKL